jgi:tetratricopeptide (TPR) repeat protein/TolB-like protein
LKRASSIAVILVLLLCAAGPVCAQSPASSSDTAIVMPFDNASGAPGIEWIAESFPELLSQRLASPTIYVLTRDDRLRAYDRAGIPVSMHPSRATIYRLLEQMDVDYVVLGRYTFDGRTFTANAQVLDMRSRKLLPESQESGPLVDLINIETSLALDLLHSMQPNLSVSRQEIESSAPPVRLDAFENYVRGILDTSAADKARHFQEAVRLNPAYSQAWFQLGKAWFDQKQYDQAIGSFAQVSLTDPAAREANFYLGLSAYYLGDFSRAESAFTFVAARMPLTEVDNNLGVMMARRGDQKGAALRFQKATQQDPADADYHFNLGVALYRSGDSAGAIRQLQECLSLRPNDADARTLLAFLSNSAKLGAFTPLKGAEVPFQRIKSNYDENSFRQLFLGIQSAAEERLARTDPVSHAQFHVSRGQELLAQGFVAEAEKQFREASTLDPQNAEAHSGIAHTLEADNDLAGARAEAEAALAIRIFIDPLLVLARLDLRDNRTDAAAQSVDQALHLDPANASALNLKRAVAAKLAQKAQPLPN